MANQGSESSNPLHMESLPQALHMKSASEQEKESESSVEDCLKVVGETIPYVATTAKDLDSEDEASQAPAELAKTDDQMLADENVPDTIPGNVTCVSDVATALPSPMTPPEALRPPAQAASVEDAKLFDDPDLSSPGDKHDKTEGVGAGANVQYGAQRMPRQLRKLTVAHFFRSVDFVL